MDATVKALVVDDQINNLILLKEILSLEGYHVEMASDGEEALKLLKQSHFDIILLDIMMPGMDGFEVCKKIKDSEHRDIPIIFLTAKAETEDVVTGFKLGGADYIRKPFSKEELIVRVKNHVRLKLMNDHIKENSEHYRESRDELLVKIFQMGRNINDSENNDE